MYKLIDKLVLECADEMLNTIDTILITDKKVACKSNCLIYIISFIIMYSILLAIVSIGY